MNRFTTKEVIEIAFHVLKNPKIKKRELPSFFANEIGVLIDYLFKKPHDLKLVYAGNKRRRLFIRFYIRTHGNGARAARHAGYSVKCAKQIAYRLLRS